MSISVTAIVIVAIVTSAVIRLARIKAGTDHLHRRHGRGYAAQALLDPAQPSPRELELQREVEALRDRVHVLERIATDANSSTQRQTQSLADEIERLRDR